MSGGSILKYTNCLGDLYWNTPTVWGIYIMKCTNCLGDLYHEMHQLSGGSILKYANCLGDLYHEMHQLSGGSILKYKVTASVYMNAQYAHKDKDKDLFIGPQEFVVGYSKAPEQPQSSARPICHSHATTRSGCSIWHSHTFLLNSHAIQWISQNTSHPDHVCDNHLVASHMWNG